MFDTLKRLIDPTYVDTGDGRVLSAWAKSENYTFKHVKDKAGGGYVVEAPAGWRAEWGQSQRPYIAGKELRFRCDTGIPGDVQMILVSKVLAQILESDVFSRFTNAMQTQIDNTLPDEMRWLAMHARVSLQPSAVLARRFVLFTNAEHVIPHWLDAPTVLALEEAASNWWTDSLLLVITLNRGILTARMAGQSLEATQLKWVSDLFAHLSARLRTVARLLA